MGQIAPPEPESRLSFVTLTQFLASLPPGPNILYDADDRSLLRWVEPSELEDPTPYLLDGEFVLTAGLPFVGEGGSPERVDAYVRRLVGAKVCALGFGLTPYHDAVPAALVEACRKHRLTLVEVPPSVPFAAVGLAFAQLLESDSARAFRQLAEANRQLMRAVLSRRPEHELLAALVQRVPSWAVLIGADGKVRARAGSAGLEASALGPLAARLLSGSGPRVEVETFDLPGARQVVGHPLRSARDDNLGALLIGGEDRLTPAQNSVVSAAVGLLELLARQRTSGSLAPGQLATALLLHPDQDGGGLSAALQDLLSQSLGAGRAGPVRVVQGVKVEAPAWPAGDSPVRELLQWRRLFDTKLVEMTGYGFAAVTRLKVDDGVLAEAEKLGWRLVVSEAVTAGRLPEAYRQVSALRARAAATRESLRVEELSWTVTGLIGREAGSMLASRLFAPLEGLDEDRRQHLTEVLRAWLGHNGSWDATAKALGLHRNSVRRQISLAAELLGADLNDTQTRTDLWIGLQYLP